mgnify:CR=1 FL=1
MSNTFNTKRARGFTLIELLVVIAIIGLLSTIIAAPIQNARKKARDAKKIAEIKAVQLALDQHAEANAGQYPTHLVPLVPTYMPLLPSFASTSLRTVADKDKFTYSAYRVVGAAIPEGIVFAYHLGVHLETFSQGLDNDRDCLGAGNTSVYETIAGTSTCAFYPAAGATVESTYASTTLPYRNYMGGMLVGTANPATGASAVPGSEMDFDGSDGDSAKCNATSDCVFDVTGQQ